MRYSWRHLLALLPVAAAGLAACLPGPSRALGESGDEPEPARRLPARVRDDPREYERIKQEWKAFLKLPETKRDRLRGIDFELKYEPPATRARLWAVLDRYTSWRERLDEKDRQQIDSAPDAATRLEVIKALREREWVAHLPKGERDQIERAAPAERAALVEKFRQKERQRRADWQAASRLQREPLPPHPQPDFWPQVRMYLNKSLVPTLTHTEREELNKAARSSWPEYAQQITDKAEKHPIQVPPSERPGVMSFRDLPKEFTQALLDRPPRPRDLDGEKLRNLQGRWPNFALAVDRVARGRKLALPDKPLGPCKPDEFVPAVRRFIEELRKDAAAAKKLDEAQGKWPDYPFVVMELAKDKDKGKRVPGTFLPGPKKFWDDAKAAQEE